MKLTTLWLPEGSVRAILSIGLVVVSGWLAIMEPDKYGLIVMTMAANCFGYYFGERKGSQDANEKV